MYTDRIADLIRFYRVETWYKNMGMALIGVAAASGWNQPILSIITLFQVFAIQLHSFSMNDYYDYRFWGEENFISRKIQNGTLNKNRITLLSLLPLIGALFFTPITGIFTILLPSYAILFYIYQGPLRWKKNYILSIILNSICLGLIPFLYPYIVLSTTITNTGIFLSLTFLLYMAFFEIAHQIEHYGEEDINSIVQNFGVETSIKLGAVMLAIPSIIGVYYGLRTLELYFFIPVMFNSLRTFKIVKSEYKRENLFKIRRSWHKFYSAFEGVLYLILIIVST